MYEDSLNRIAGASWYKSRLHRRQRLFSRLCHSSTSIRRLYNRATCKGPRQERSNYLERKFQGTKVPWNERSRERMFQGTNIVLRTKVPGNERSRERWFQGTIRMVSRTKVPSWERMFQGTNSLGNEYSCYTVCDPLLQRVASVVVGVTSVEMVSVAER